MNFLQRLRDSVPDESEIEPVLSLAAGGGGSRFSANSVEYRSGPGFEEVFARLRFNGNRISRLELGPSLQSIEAQNGLVERAKFETAHTHGSFVAIRPIFSERPLTGVYTWNDSVQIEPCPKSAPIGRGLNWFDHGLPSEINEEGYLGPPFPLLLSVRIPRSPNSFVETNRTFRLLDRYQYLFTLLLTGNLRYVHWPSGRIWTSVAKDGAIENHLLHPGFSIGENGRQDDFMNQGCAPASGYQGNDYYDQLWVGDAELHIPSSLAGDLSLFASFGPHEADAFVRACYWYALGVQFKTEPAVSTVAFSTAIECLLPKNKRTPCKECGKPIGLGPTQLFNRHIKRYGTVIPALEGQRKALYGARSALVHGTHASRVDIAFFSAQRHAQDHLLLLQIVCERSLINWLRDPNRSDWLAVTEKVHNHAV